MTNNEKLTLARSALENLAYRGEDFDAQYTALDTLKKIDAIATESAPAAGAASIPDPSLWPCGDCGRSVKEACENRPCGYRAMQQQANAALAQRAAGELPPLPEPANLGDASIGYVANGYTADQMNARYSEGFEAGKRLAHEQACTITHGLMAERDAARAQLAARAVGGVDVSGLTRYVWTEAYIGDTSELVEAPNGTYVKFDDVRALLAAAPAAPVANPFDAEWLKFTATRMRVVLSHLGLSDPFPDNDKALCEVIGTVLGNVRMELQKPAPVGDGDERALYTCIGKGGEYEVIGTSHPAGQLRGIVDSFMTVYRDTATGRLYHRIPPDFEDRMQRIDRAALTQQKG